LLHDCCASISGDLFVAAFYSLLVCVAAESSYFGRQMFKWASELQVPGGSHSLDPSFWVSTLETNLKEIKVVMVNLCGVP
jgi:hypothetical protein